MGSRGIFSESTCLICYNKIARIAIEPRVCMACQIKVKRTYIVNKLPLLSDYIQENIARMLVNYKQARCARLWHLEMVLLGRLMVTPIKNWPQARCARFVASRNWSLQLNWFHKLTSILGNISSTEDIFDLILSFLR